VGESTGISWTDHTANFWRGCHRVSPGCENCYAEALVVHRQKLPLWGPPKTTLRRRGKSVWKDVPRWDRAARDAGVRRRVFVSSLSDIFEAHPQVAPWRAEALALLATCTHLDVQLLTKRPENIRGMVPPAWLDHWPRHLWVGTTVEDQRRAEERIPHLLRVPAPVRFLSCEPLLGAVDLTMALEEFQPLNPDLSQKPPPVQWVIVGGESGPDARSFEVVWARSILRQCIAAGVPCFVKQLGDNPRTTLPASEVWPSHGLCGKGVQFNGDGFGHYQVTGLAHHGADPSEWPAHLRVREFPGGSP